MRGGGGNTRFIPGGRRRPMANLGERRRRSSALQVLPRRTQAGLDLDFVRRFVARLTDFIIGAILRITGAG